MKKPYENVGCDVLSSRFEKGWCSIYIKHREISYVREKLERTRENQREPERTREN